MLLKKLHSKIIFGVHAIPFLSYEKICKQVDLHAFNIDLIYSFAKRNIFSGEQIASNTTVSCNTSACTRTIDTTENIVVIIGDEKASQSRLKIK